MLRYKRTLGIEDGGDIYRDSQQKADFFDGVRGVKQELKITLATVQGEQPFAEDFGLDVFAATGAPPAIVRREVRLALEDDDRVKSVDDVIVGTITENRTTEVTVNLTLVDGEQLQLNGVEL